MPYKIISKMRLNKAVSQYEIEAPLVAKNAKTGQFVILRVDEKGERVPLTIVKSDALKGTVTIVAQEIGKTTLKLSALNSGDKVSDILGPLGRPTSFGTVGKMMLVAGGVGIAELLPVIKYAKENRNDTTAIIGARSKDLLILEDELRKFADRFIITTDDGTCGEKGLVTQPLKRLLEAEKFSLCYAVGPDVMMKAVCETTRPYSLKTIVSLDANMLDATGICGTCRVRIGGKIKFTCVDGPEADGHEVDFDDFMKRQKRFAEEEKKSLEAYKNRPIKE